MNQKPHPLFFVLSQNNGEADFEIYDPNNVRSAVQSMYAEEGNECSGNIILSVMVRDVKTNRPGHLELMAVVDGEVQVFDDHFAQVEMDPALCSNPNPRQNSEKR